MKGRISVGDEHQKNPLRLRTFALAPLFIIAACSCSFMPSRLDRSADEILSRMSAEQKISQLFMVPVDGSSKLGSAESAFLAEAQPGAVILFGFNVSGGAQASRSLTASIQDALAAAPLPALVAVDHEGGAVFRFKDSLTFIPAAAEQGAKLDAKGIEALAKISGAQLRSLGISVNLAPVVEPLQPWNSGFLGDRAYSPDPKAAAKFAAAFARGMRRAGVAATLKHFPGNAADDPHKGLPVLALEGKALKRYAIAPFKNAIASSKADIVMLSHAKVPAIDPELPVSLSPAAVGLLRRKLAFQGIVLTDDLEMGALASDRTVSRSALLAFMAGADMLMLSSRAHFAQSRRELLEALKSGEIDDERLDDSARRIVRLKLSLGLLAERDPAAREAGFARLPSLLSEGLKFVNERFR
jgi:beta-N-acetylhexosaminidase